MRTWIKNRLFYALAGLLTGLTLVIAACNWLIVHQAEGFLYDDFDSIPANRVGIVLGTSRFTSDGAPNYHYQRRIEAAAELLKKHKIRFILVSGDNGTPWYDEPSRMKKDLVRRGVPEELIYRDYAGFRTLDSVLRARDVFGLNSYTIISQQFHNERALYIAREHNISAIAFNARGEIPLSDYSSGIRELLARVLAVLDTKVFNSSPLILGPEIEIGTTPPT